MPEGGPLDKPLSGCGMDGSGHGGVNIGWTALSGVPTQGLPLKTVD